MTIITRINVNNEEKKESKCKNHHPIWVNHFQHLTLHAANIIDPISIAPANAIITE